MQTALMADFADEALGHKPATWCKACTEITRQNRYPSACDKHTVSRCPKCQTKITEAHVCLTFVGHADVRARLCEIDPEWTWEPFEFPGTGSLILSADGSPVGLWIHLIVGGVRKPGYGSCEKGKPEAVKELIGDALRNAGLSFGIAWKLWAKGERTGGDAEAHGAPEGNGHQQGKDEDWRNLPPVNKPRRQGGNGQAQEAPPPPAADDPALGAWAAKLDEITSVEDVERALNELDREHESGHLDSRQYKGLKAAVAEKGSRIAGRRPTAPDAEARGAQPVATGKGDDGEWVQGWLQRVTDADIPARLVTLQAEIGNAVRARTISPAKSADLSKRIQERRRELEGAPA